jgi:hypothetical protein
MPLRLVVCCLFNQVLAVRVELLEVLPLQDWVVLLDMEFLEILYRSLPMLEMAVLLMPLVLPDIL